MKIKLLFILLYSAFLFGQKPVELKIESITSVDENQDERTFTINYSISNKSDKVINFILNPEGLIPIGSGSMKPFIYYKIYQNDSSIDVSDVFTGKKVTRYFKNDEEVKKFQDSLFEVVKSKPIEVLLQDNKNNTLKNIQEMQAGETRKYSKTIRWNKNRYFKNDVMEYYIDEKEKHYFELHINLMKEELLSKFSEDEKNEILKDKNFIKGWFTSNKVEINFGE